MRDQKVQRIDCYDNPKFSMVEDRIIRIRLSGVVMYTARHEMMRFITEPFKKLFGKKLPGFTEGYRGRVRGDFCLNTFFADAANEDQIKWILDRMPDKFMEKMREAVPSCLPKIPTQDTAVTEDTLH